MGQRPTPAPARHVLGKGLGSVGDEVELTTNEPRHLGFFGGLASFLCCWRRRGSQQLEHLDGYPEGDVKRLRASQEPDAGVD